MFQDDLYLSASRLCRNEAWDYAALFKYQFRLSESDTSPCDEWDSVRIGRWHLHHCPSLLRHELRLTSGKLAGFVLGVAVDDAGDLLSGPKVLNNVNTLKELESYIENLSGRYIAVVSLGGRTRVYFDPSGGLSAVFSEADRRVASSVHVLADRDIDPLETPHAKDVLERRAMYALGETCDKRCRRVFANHYLDLESFQLVRHWPRAGDVFDDTALTRDEIAQEIAARLARIMNALTRGYRCSLPLTGGTDSRILLSASGGCLDAIDKFYIHHIRFITRFDLASAQAMAGLVGVPLHVINRQRDPSFMTSMTDDEVETERRKMALRTSLSFSGLEGLTVRAVRLAPESDLILRGNVAEMSRANKWTQETAVQGVSTEFGLATLLNLTTDTLSEVLPPDRYNDLMARYESWSRTLPEQAQLRLPDVAHTEVFMPAMPSNVYYAFDKSFYINPYNDRRIIHLTAQFHPLARRRRRLVKKIIGNGMPDLNSVPYLGYFRKAHFQKLKT